MALYACAVAVFVIVFLCLILNIGTVWSVVKKFLVIINPLIYGFVIAFVINPLVKVFEKRVFVKIRDKSATDGKGDVTGIRSRKKLRRVLSMIVTYLIVTALLAVFVTMLIPQVAESYTELTGKMSGYIGDAQEWAKSLLNDAQTGKGVAAWVIKRVDVEKLSENISGVISDSFDLVQRVSPYIVKFISSIIDSVKNAMIGIIVSIYFLYSKERLCAQMRKIQFAFFKDKTADNVLRVARRTSTTFEKFISGKLLDSLIIGCLTFFVLMIFGMPFYPLIAVIVGITNIIPFFGPFIGAIPSAFIIFVVDPLKCIWFIVIIVIIQQIDGNIIGPKILGGQTGLSALWVIISITVMGGIFGITGMLIGVPVVAVMYSLLSELIANRLLAKGRAVYTESYEDVMETEEIISRDEERRRRSEALPEMKKEKLMVRVNEKVDEKVKDLIDKVKKDGKK